MTTLIVLPETDEDSVDVDRAIKLVTDRFRGHEETIFAAPKETVIRYAAAVPVHTLHYYVPGESEAGHNTVVYITSRQVIEGIEWPKSQRVYRYQVNRLDLSGRGPFRQVQPAEFDETEHLHLDRHVFNRLGPKKWGFENFPYGCLYMDPESGPIDPFGFRIQEDYRPLASRDNDHLLVAVFGGSAAFSVYCQINEMFPARLEQKLSLALERVGKKITVLNFGMHDNVVMQEMMTYLLFVQQLRPDVVISHSGHNDIWYGLRNDPYLVTQHNIIYQQHAEYWSYLLHQEGDVPEEIPVEFNLKHNILTAMMVRHRQFHELVEAGNGRFIWGVQPLLFDRKTPHIREIEYLDDLTKFLKADPRRRKMYNRVASLIAELPSEVDKHGDFEFIDFPSVFADAGPEQELMWDHVHANPEGDEIIADCYTEHLLGLWEID